MSKRSFRVRAHGTVGGLEMLVLALIAWIPSHRIRRALFSMIGLSLAPGAHLYRGAEIWAPRGITIGANTSVGTDCILDGRGGIVLGENVNLSSQAAIWTMQHSPDDPEFGVVSAPVHVGDRAWISFRATILPGVTVGQGAVVAAGAVVTKDVAPFTMVGGIPAKKIGERSRDLRYVLDPPPPFT